MTLAARISEERERLAAAKDRLRSRRQLARAQPLVPDAHELRPRAVEVGANRRFDFRSPKSTGVSVKVIHRKSPKLSAVERKKRAAAAADVDHIDGEFARRLRHLTSREAALSARVKVAENKLEFAEVELTTKANMCDSLKTRVQSLEKSISQAEESLRSESNAKNEAVSQREVARQRIFVLTERNSVLEKDCDRFRAQAQQSSDEFSNIKDSSQARIDVLERELARCRALLEETEAGFRSAHEKLSIERERADRFQASSKERTSKSLSLEARLAAEQATHAQHVQRLGLLEAELQSRDAQVRQLQADKSEQDACLAGKLERVQIELDESRARESGLKEELESTRKQLAQTRADLEDRIQQLGQSSSDSLEAQRKRDQVEAKLSAQVRQLEQQLARNTLEHNAKIDAASRQIADLQAISKEKQTPAAVPQAPPREQLLREHGHYEEVVIDIDLPDGSSSQIVLQAADDPHRVIADFCEKHGLGPSRSKKLEEFVYAQMNVEPATPTSFTAPPLSPPPPPPPVSKEQDSSRMMYQYENKEEKVESAAATTAKIEKSESRLRRLSRLRERGTAVPPS